MILNKNGNRSCPRIETAFCTTLFSSNRIFRNFHFQKFSDHDTTQLTKRSMSINVSQLFFGATGRKEKLDREKIENQAQQRKRQARGNTENTNKTYQLSASLTLTEANKFRQLGSEIYQRFLGGTTRLQNFVSNCRTRNHFHEPSESG